MRRDIDDVLWGGILALLGLGVAAHASVQYDMGDLRRMGPGFFPIVLGVVLFGLGLIIGLPAWWRKTEAKPLAWRETLAVAASLLFFGFALDRVGLLLTTAITVLLASSVAPHKGILWRVVLSAAITLLAAGVFILALQMPIPVWPWSR